MKQLNKHKLNFTTVFKYVQFNLYNVNTLSSELLKFINFNHGNFFTLLPNDANIERLYNFETGLILPQNSEKKYVPSEGEDAYSVIPTIRNELSELILKEIKSNNRLSCVFDDVIRSPMDKYHMELFHSHGLFYKNEVYYLLEKSKISKDLIRECLRASNAFWHSLCILTKVDIKSFSSKELSLEKIKDICLQTDLIMLVAYDGEGYILWEHKDKQGDFI